MSFQVTILLTINSSQIHVPQNEEHHGNRTDQLIIKKSLKHNRFSGVRNLTNIK